MFLRLAGEWDKLLAVVDWIARRQRPGMYLRQVDVPCVDTKFIERHRGVLAELLDQRLDPRRVDSAGTDFASRYGFAGKPDYVRFRCPFRGLSEASVRVDELTTAPPGVSRVYVVENEITYLAFPLPEKAMVIWGRGYAVDALAPLDRETLLAHRDLALDPAQHRGRRIRLRAAGRGFVVTRYCAGRQVGSCSGA